jgi:hypothetical protein
MSLFYFSNKDYTHYGLRFFFASFFSPRPDRFANILQIIGSTS